MNDIVLNKLNLQLASSSAVIMTIVLMLIMAIILMLNYRNKNVYILLITGLSLVIVQQLLSLLPISSHSTEAYIVAITSTSLQTMSFILINFVFIKLYTSQAALRTLPFIGLFILTVVLAVGSIFIEPFIAARSSLHSFSFPMLDFFIILLIVIMLVATRQANMTGKYYASLVFMFAYELALISDTYIFNDSQLWLTICIHFFPVIYYSILFTLLFEWVIERLLSTYQSSIMDGLTGLYVRKYFNKKLNHMISLHKVSIIFCDIDNFKQLNDTKGHQIADEVLRQVASIIKEEVAPYGIAGRYGGEELLGGIDIDKVKPEHVAENIRRRIEQESTVSVSIGFSTSKEGSNLQEMIKQSDKAMYHSKLTGKNKVTSYRSISKPKKKSPHQEG